LFRDIRLNLAVSLLGNSEVFTMDFTLLFVGVYMVNVVSNICTLICFKDINVSIDRTSNSLLLNIWYIFD